MKTLAEVVETEVIIKKSRFLGRVEPINSQEEAKEKLAKLHAQHPDARHICYCMLVAGQVSQSDDGEPSGTAAAPMLRVLQHKQLDQVLASVVRYFGGIKLGAGGLVRAYSQAVSDPLNTAELITLRELSQVQLAMDYEFQSLVRHQAEQAGLNLEVDYQQQLQVRLEGEEETLKAVVSRLMEASSGRMTLLK
ncbi:IMPACT family protein [Marinospirillum perlucidum]|uniref:IMPACT family protein n=1 Tax=Marinospirillum perlucidum TaxID=1982602 RepID=UPI00139061FC|nr:YigZ family protein [Marinospirillum perlucidum]